MRAVSSLPTIAIAPAVEITPAADDPLVIRRGEITRELLREGIRRLSPLERDALRLATRERMPVPEAAAQLGVAPGIVESNLRSGLLSLRQSLLVQLEEVEP
jgi:DNA-directed RNA polymerase specialized sigma24 family protein